MTAGKVTATVLAAARTHRADAERVEAEFPGVIAWFGVFTREWWAIHPAAGQVGPAATVDGLRHLLLAKSRPLAGTRPTFTPSPTPAAAPSTPAADRAARGAGPLPQEGSAPRYHRGGRHAR